MYYDTSIREKRIGVIYSTNASAILVTILKLHPNHDKKHPPHILVANLTIMIKATHTLQPKQHFQAEQN
jgi:hypothetical protein